MKNITDVEKFEERSEGKLIVVDDTNSPFAMTKLGLSHGQSLADIEKMLELQIKYDENEAKKAYYRAMSEFKKDAPKIEKISKVNFSTSKGQTSYSHADLADAAEKINEKLGKNGLSATWDVQQNAEKVTVKCTITHQLGHSESTSLFASPDTSGTKNAIQALGSTITYLERYTLFAITGLAAHGTDDDGAGAGGQVEYISDKQLSTILDLINGKGADETKFCEYMKVEEVKEILSKDFNKAIIALNKKKKATREPGEEG